MTDAPRTLAIDIGGTGLKMIALDEGGKAVSKRTKVKTPRPATPEALLGALMTMVTLHGDFDRVSIGFPGVVVRGVVRTAPNLHPQWAGFDMAAAIERRTQKPTRVANDADVQGMGVIGGHGVELVVTLGTGFGSALFVDGCLVPNLELGHHPFADGKTYEELLGKAALERDGVDRWLEILHAAVRQLSHTFNFDTLYIGGGHAALLRELGADFGPDVDLTENVAGLLGGIALWKEG